MFVQYLSERQQGVLLHYAHEMMRADSMVDARELSRLDVLRAQSRPGVEEEDMPIEKLSELFDDRLSRIVLLLELTGMGYVDEKFGPRESELVSKLADALAIDEEGVMDDIKAWVQRQFLLVKEAHQLMEG